MAVLKETTVCFGYFCQDSFPNDIDQSVNGLIQAGKTFVLTDTGGTVPPNE
jgi:hypothetical protein